MNKSKSSEQQRLESVKQQTYKGYRVDELGSGYVKDQIGEWEKLFMLRQATEEQVASTAAEGFRKLATMSLQQSVGDVVNVEDGSTSVFRLSDLVDTDRVSLIQRLIRQAGGRSAPLRSGLYALEDGKKPPIDITAVAIMGDDGQCFVALTVNVIKGMVKELTSRDNMGKEAGRAYGVKRVVVTTLDSDLPLLQKLFNITPRTTPQPPSFPSPTPPAPPPQPPAGPFSPSPSKIEPGIVLKRVSEFEDLIMMQEHDPEDLKTTRESGLSLLRAHQEEHKMEETPLDKADHRPPTKQSPDVGSPESVDPVLRELGPRDYEDFEEGTTRIFPLNSLVTGTRANVVYRMVMDNGGRGQSAELLAGVYVFKDTMHPPLDITALALMAEESNDVYVAITIHGTSKGEGTLTEKGVYGGKRVMVAARPGEPPLLEKVFNIIRNRNNPVEPLSAFTPTKDGVSGSGTIWNANAVSFYDFLNANVLASMGKGQSWSKNIQRKAKTVRRPAASLVSPSCVPHLFAPILLWGRDQPFRARRRSPRPRRAPPARCRPAAT